MMRKIIYFILILSIVYTQQRPPAAATRRPPSNIVKRPAGGKMTSLRDLDYEVIKLSYIETDRALAILKTIGYSVVEFKAGKGEIAGENNFTPQFSNKNMDINAPGTLPIIIKFPDTETISLVEKSKSKSSSKKSVLGVDLGGVTLDNTTSGDPMQRLLVGYKPGDFNSVARLLDIIQNKIDTPANQIVIEALVLELNSDQLDELGIDFSNAGQGYSQFSRHRKEDPYHLSPWYLIAHCWDPHLIFEPMLKHLLVIKQQKYYPNLLSLFWMGVKRGYKLASKFPL